MVAAFAFSGFLGSLALASALFLGRPRWVSVAGATVAAGTAIGGLMGVHLLATVKGVVSLCSAGDILALYMVLWQAAVGASLGRGVLPTPTKIAALDGGPATAPDDSDVTEGPPSVS